MRQLIVISFTSMTNPKTKSFNNSFSYSEEKYILKSYKNIITNSENTKRLENLIWKKQWSSANRQLKRVSSDIKQFSIATQWVEHLL